MPELLEDRESNVRLGMALERAAVAAANAGEQAARGCRGVVVARWRNILKIIQKGGSATSISARVRDEIRAAGRDLIGFMGSQFEKLADASARFVDEATFKSLTKNQAAAVGLLEDDADDYLTVASDPIQEWAPGRKIHPLPPDPGPARKVHYTFNRERVADKKTSREIIKGSDYAKRMEKWSKQITNNSAVANAIADGVAKGQSLEEIAKKIEPHVRNLSSSAMRIVRTEAARIHNEVAELNYAQYDSITAGYRVINPLDERTRPEHRKRAREKNANGLVGRIYWRKGNGPKGAKYSADDRPALPDAPNCRCSYVPVMIDPDKEIVHGKPKGKGPVDDIEHDVDEETLEKFRQEKMEREGRTEKKARAGVRGASEEVLAKMIGTREWVAANKVKKASNPPLSDGEDKRANSKVRAISKSLQQEGLDIGTLFGEPKAKLPKADWSEWGTTVVEIDPQLLVPTLPTLSAELLQEIDTTTLPKVVSMKGRLLVASEEDHLRVAKMVLAGRKKIFVRLYKKS